MSSRQLKDNIAGTGCALGCLSVLVAPAILWSMKQAADYAAQGPYSVSTMVRSSTLNTELGDAKITYGRNHHIIDQFDLADKVSIVFRSEGTYFISVNKVELRTRKGPDELEELVPLIRSTFVIDATTIKDPLVLDLKQFKLEKDSSFLDVTRLQDSGKQTEFGTLRL